MRCSTIRGTDIEKTCTGIATHMLLGSMRGEDISNAVCEPCGQAYTRRPALKARIVPRHVYTPTPEFTAIIEGHRLVEDAEHGARCHDCGGTGSIEQFKLTMLHGCPARPESFDHLKLTRDTNTLDANGRAAESARMWFHETTHVFGMPIGDWRPVADHPTTAAYFTFGDREYRLKYDLAGYGMAAEKLENRGKPAPEVINPEFRETYQQVVFRFHDLVSKYETTFFATWTPDREDVPLYAPEGQIAAVLRVELDGTGTREWRLGVVTDALCDAFGSVAQIKYQDWVYE